MRPMLAAVAAISLAATAALAHDAPKKDAYTWGPAPAVFPAGAQMAVLSGDPGGTGLFTVRLRFPQGYAIAAHNHPTDELVTVIDGNLSLGMGDKLDKAAATTLKAGGYTVAPAKMNHYAFTNSGAVVQITAQGPFALTYVNPADDPTAH